MIVGHGGNIVEVAARLGVAPSRIADMSSNVNPLGPPPGLLRHLESRLADVEALPEPDAGSIRKAFADRHGIPPERVLAGNGTTQFIYAIPEALRCERVLVLGPTYSDYADACGMRRIPCRVLAAEESRDFRHDWGRVETEVRKADAVFVCNPNNPTGAKVSRDRLERLRGANPGVFFIVDESYLPFVPGGESESMLANGGGNLLVLNSMSKIFRVPGLRIGFVAASEDLIERFYRYYLPWSVNSLAQAAVSHLMACGEETDRFVRDSQAFLAGQREAFAKALDKVPGIRLFPSLTSFVLAKLTGGPNSGEAFERMAEKLFLIRDCRNFQGLSDRFVRVSLKTADVNAAAAAALAEIVGQGVKGGAA